MAGCGPIYPKQAAPAPAPGPAPAAGGARNGSPGSAIGSPGDPYAATPGGPSATEPPGVPSAAAPPGVPADMAALLAAHNAMRARHCAAPLAWSPALAAQARSWADSLAARNCAFEHSPGNAHGENLAGGSPGYLDGSSVTAMWYDEVSQYRFPDGGFGMDTGHFTQLVWRGTTAVGCAQVTCSMNLWVCEYDPPGNVDSEYASNVLPTSCH